MAASLSAYSGSSSRYPGSVANYRKQESSVSQVIDFLTPDFRIWPQKGKFATEPSYAPLGSLPDNPVPVLSISRCRMPVPHAPPASPACCACGWRRHHSRAGLRGLPTVRFGVMCTAGPSGDTAEQASRLPVRWVPGVLVRHTARRPSAHAQPLATVSHPQVLGLRSRRPGIERFPDLLRCYSRATSWGSKFRRTTVKAVGVFQSC